MKSICRIRRFTRAPTTVNTPPLSPVKTAQAVAASTRRMVLFCRPQHRQRTRQKNITREFQTTRRTPLSTACLSGWTSRAALA